MADGRWPGWVYDEGNEPDPRWSFANERTFLAWIRTALALLAGGVALDAITVPLADGPKKIVMLLLLLLGLGCAGSAWFRWARSERAMRRGEPLPSSPFTAVLAVAIAVATVVLVIGLW